MKKNMTCAGVASLLLIFLLAPSFGAYHVMTSGNDTSGDGSLDSPWATIEKALTSVADGSLILVHAGTYTGRTRLRGNFSSGVVVRSEPLYQVRLRNSGPVITTYDNNIHNITIEGFDIAHNGAGASALVVHIDGGGAGEVSHITLKNNILHDSYNNDILKINNGADHIEVVGNVFYNQTGSDEHIDINSVQYVSIKNNIFFNDFEGSSRVNLNNTSSYIVIKDSNGSDDIYLGSRYIRVAANVFLNWQGSDGSNFVLVGEDGKNYFEGRDITIENNLMLGNSEAVMRAPFGVKGGRDILFRNNTVSGDMPSLAYAMRLNREGANPANTNIVMVNNIWSDQTGTMGATNPTATHDFSDTPVADTTSFTLNSNLYWNDSNPIPYDGSELVNYTDDSRARIANPQLVTPAAVDLPRWKETTTTFADGSSTIEQARIRLITLYCMLPGNSPAVDRGDDTMAPVADILGKQRPAGDTSDIGACEYQPPGGGGVKEGETVVPQNFLLLR